MSPRPALALWLVIVAPLMVWLVIDGMSPAGPTIAVVTSLVGLVITAVGYLVLRAFYPRDRGAELLLIAPAAGLVVVGAIAAFAAVAGSSLAPVFWVATICALPGLWLGARSMRSLWKTPTPSGRPIILGVITVALVYFLPVSLYDGVSTASGGFQWMYVDSVFHHAIVSMLTTGVMPVRVPAFSQMALVYHFGPHAIAATIVSVFAIEPGDAFFRVVRPLGLLSLTLSVLAVGRWTARDRSEVDLAGVCALFLVFIMGGVYTAFTQSGSATASPADSNGKVGRLLTYLPEADGYKAHFMVGSGLWGMLVLFLVVALVVYRHRENADTTWGMGPEILLAPLGFCANLLAGASIFAVVVVHALIFGWRRWATYAWTFAGFVTLAGTLYAGGFLEPQSYSSLMRLSPTPILIGKLASVTAWLVIGLGVKAIALALIGWGRRTTVVLIVLLVVGYTAAYVAIVEYTYSEVYALLFVNALLGGFAAAPAAMLLSQWRQPDAQVIHRLRASLGSYFCFACGFAVVTVLIVILFSPGPVNIALPGSVLAISVTVLGLMRSRLISRAGMRRFLVGFTAIFVMLSSLSWTRSVFNIGWNHKDNAVSVDAGIVRSLFAVFGQSSPDALVATTHHAVPGLQSMPNRSYVYAALTRRYMLLEGWEYGSVRFAARFEQTKQDNETLFGTDDPDEALRIIRAYGITHLLTEPGTSLGFDPSGLKWLKPLDTGGTVGAWEVVRPAARSGLEVRRR